MMGVGRLRPLKSSKRKKKSTAPASCSENASGAEITIANKKTRFRNKIIAPLSPLEQHPVELLQEIFLYSANVDLPLVSKPLLAALSSDHLKFEITLQAFVYQAETLDAKIRSKLLTRRFFTWDFLLRYIKFAHDKGWPIAYWNAMLGNDNQFRFDAFAKIRAERSEIGFPTLEQLDAGLTSLACEAEVMVDDARTDASRCEKTRRALPSLQGAFKVEIPEKLLHGFGDKGRLLLLKLLLMFSCHINLSDSTAPETAVEGAFEAIKQSNSKALRLLFRDGIGVKPTQEMLELAMQTGNREILYVLLNQNEGSGVLDCFDAKIHASLKETGQWSESDARVVQRWLVNGISYAEEWDSSMD